MKGVIKREQMGWGVGGKPLSVCILTWPVGDLQSQQIFKLQVRMSFH